MNGKKFEFALLGFLLFIVLLVAEFLYCSANFRFIRSNDLWTADLICAVLGLVLSYVAFKKVIKLALQEKVPVTIIVILFLILSCLLGWFLRFNLQIANGLLDPSEPETIRVIITHKETSVLGGSIKDGMNPMAYYIDFPDWNNKDQNCQLLVPYPFYFSVSEGSTVDLLVRKGLFNLNWIEAYESRDS
jgi:hypothetical protein